jgi:hypothetical protein
MKNLSFSMLICTLVGAPAEVIAALEDQNSQPAIFRPSSSDAVPATASQVANRMGALPSRGAEQTSRGINTHRYSGG